MPHIPIVAGYATVKIRKDKWININPKKEEDRYVLVKRSAYGAK